MMPPTIEPLQSRRLLAVNLYPSTVTAQQQFAPGAAITFDMKLRNAGTEHVTRPFFVEFKLVPSPHVGPWNNDFYDPAARVLAKVPVTQTVPHSSGTDLRATVQVPSDVAPGRWMIIGAVDSTLAVAETDESDNYFHIYPTRIIPPDKRLVFQGTDGDDSFFLERSQYTPQYHLSINDYSEFFDVDDVVSFELRGLGGNDTIRIRHHVPSLLVDAGDGNDRIEGGDAPETLAGGAGKDWIFGGTGNDRLNGNGGHDELLGGAGADRLYGYAGDDLLDGGSSGDRLEGGAGKDRLYGAGGNDRFFARDTETDQLFGGSGDN